MKPKPKPKPVKMPKNHDAKAVTGKRKSYQGC